jgi:VWFA-related protein
MTLAVSCKIIAILLTLAILGNVAAAQAVFSESREYTPRELSEKQKKKIKRPKLSEPRVTEITLPVSVRSSATGAYVKDLTRDDFAVFIGGEQREIVKFESSANTPRNVVFLLDNSPSSSMISAAILELVNEAIDALAPNDRIMIARFNQELEVAEKFTTDRTRLKDSIKKFKVGDGTSIYDTVRELNTKTLAAETEHVYVLIITDGVDTTSRRTDFERSLLDAEKGNVTCFPIYLDTFSRLPPSVPVRGRIPGMNLPFPVIHSPAGQTAAEYQIGREYLDGLASVSGGRPYYFDTPPSVRTDIIRSIIADLRSRYEIRVRAPEPSDTIKHHRVKVRVARPNLTITAPGSVVTGY